MLLDQMKLWALIPDVEDIGLTYAMKKMNSFSYREDLR
jgi:hypothetical protein